MKRYEFLGYPVDSLTTDEALMTIDRYIEEHKPHRITPINASKLCRVDSDSRLANIIKKSDMVIPEYAVIWGANQLKIKLAEHIGGIMLMRSILEKAPFKNYKIYFLGAKEEVVTEMVKRLKREHRDLNITGYHHGYFTSENDREIIEDIRSKCPDILLVAMGTPKQEVWIDDHFEELNVPVVMGVGGSFDVFAGLTKETPDYLRCGFEWLYRLAQDPKRLWKRYITTNPKFVWKVLKAKWGLNGSGKVAL
ncbi:MAG: glycosyltransferase [candidate division Zixibacteria bacterium CG_4_9_14_3_um_filter_46_8]|nr:MAG: glycosyltransferase [candidate division Zixibacteria bacterium CG_4_9_14_3_um_filter_46_8]